MNNKNCYQGLALRNSRLIVFFIAVVFILLTATISHFLFSHLGFNPTDNGFILAGSRRILDGQIPHRDFISIRTAGSHFLHVPLIAFGGDYTFWTSRYLAWIQFASIAWIWTIIIARSFKAFPSLAEKFAAALIAFSFSVHHFPITVWHTLDALFFVSLGVILCFRQHKSSKMLGYILIGIAPLCKQNFLVMIPITIIFFNDWRQKRFWLMASIPIIVYITYLAINGAIPDAILQLTTHTNLLSSGVKIYLSHLTTLLGLLTGYLAMRTIYGKSRLFGNFILMGVPLISAFFLATGRYVMDTSFGIFGVILGVILYSIIKEKKVISETRCGLLIIFTAWCISISKGYNTPALATGPLILFLIACWQFVLRKSIKIPLVLLAIISLTAFGIGRENYIYRELSASYLNRDLGNVFPGAKLLRTNNNTYRFLLDLQKAKNIVKSRGKNYCIIPDVAANWVRSSQSNPLSVDWPQGLELRKRESIDRVIGDLEAHRDGIIIIVQKYETYSLAVGFVPLANTYSIVNYVRSNFNKIEETQFFELYE